MCFTSIYFLIYENNSLFSLKTLYNVNFLDIPFIGHVVNFYLLFNIAPFPILTMTLRNNLIKVFAPSKIPKNVK